MRRGSLALSLAVLLVLAGCAAPVGSGPPRSGDESATERTTRQPTDSPAEGDRVVVRGGSLPVDADAVYGRVQELTGLEGGDVEVVVEEPGDERGQSSAPEVFGPLGLTGGSPEDIDCGGLASASASGDQVRIVAEGLTTAEVELVLVHEFVHTLQEDADLTVPGDGSDWDSLYARVALLEGTAVYVADRYAKRYDLTWSGDRSPLELRECLYDQAPDGVRAVTGVYHFGGQYFDAAVDDPTDLTAAFADLPNTTEGVIHGEPAGEDPPTPLSVDADAPEWGAQKLGSYGEFTTRIALATALNESRAAAAAEGWGNDVVVRLGSDASGGYVWVHRWDDAAEADEFAAAAAAYAAARREAGVAMRVVQVGPETTALVFGDSTLVDAASVERDDDGSVTVTVSDSASPDVTRLASRGGPPDAVVRG